ncbi:FixH family protein [Paenibacillus alvei]|uniref:FixH family protein n=1 Tax=Paenibacillus alvei TaxID=44250 RepID=A0ABT4H636_PAEAL|nr:MULTISPECIES: FixH family protein [Paenibacillus]EJW15682.1 hypothetical protein PAV_7c00550 [Paenibacillus alvei DSM 29]MBG9736224.1 hypothetical protein [Paenibacillus alvei]MBG9745923.1 hypothetical protein [Paenibacillus alvei]MCY7487600.1 FixH family protein [Paenibacillus alvei]MCY9543799.1 FixH family protein [Paenibacillus alvei]
MFSNKNKLIVLIMAIGAMLLTGCGNSSGSSSSSAGHEGHAGHGSGAMQEGNHEMPAMIKVELQVPKEVKSNEAATISARVTQDDKAVDDADKVEFELWMDGEEHEMIEGKPVKDGTYQFEKTFKKAGTYTVISHVTARDMHSMPKKQFTVK